MDPFHARHAGIFDPDVLREKRVLIAGCGSIGSVLAMLLVRAGVTRFRFVDPDHVTVTNLCRTVYRAADVGHPKVVALAAAAAAVRDGLDLEPHEDDLLRIPEETLLDWLEDSDLVVAATDHPGVQARLAHLSYHRKPAVFPGVYARGTGGEVIFTLPDQTPCYSCVLGSLRGADLPSRGSTDYGIATGQLAAEPALGIDIEHVTVIAAKIALALLLHGTGAATDGILDPARSVLFVGNTVDWIWRAPFETVWARTERRSDCICRQAPGASTASIASTDDL